VRSPPPEDEVAAQTTCDELTATPITRPLAPLGGRRERNRSEVGPGKKGGVGGESGLRVTFISHYPTLICLVMN